MDGGQSMRGSNLRNTIHNFFHHRQVNVLVTTFFIFISIYMLLISMIGQNVLHPYSEWDNSTLGSEPQREFVNTTMSLFFLTLLGLFVGKLFSYIMVPPLFGALLVGIALRNIPFLSDIIYVNAYWDFCVRRFAFIAILVRCGIGLNLDTLKRNPVVPVLVGFLSPICEVLAVCLAAHLIFGVSLVMSIIFGLLLAANSPAVTVPTMLDMQNEGLGTERGVPTLVLAAASLDNLLCITAISVAYTLTFSTDAISSTIILTIGELAIAILGGFVAGWLLGHFPRSSGLIPDPHTHLARIILVSAASCAIVFGTTAIKCDFAGVIAVLIMCIVAAARWKNDNAKKVTVEQSSLAAIWNLLLQPLMFTLIGLKFDFSKMTWYSVLVGLACLAIGVAVRIVSIYILTTGQRLRFREKTVLAMAFIPKATVQAALAPTLVTLAASSAYVSESWLILNSCVVAILVTAPIGQFLLQLCAPHLLSREFVQSVQIAPMEERASYMETPRIDEIDNVVSFKQFKTLQQYRVENGHLDSYKF